ncbi:MAG: hypothetical protein OEU94_17325 [Aquincola sp.]|nr:hypothetical protein [Aquincola sp.]
MAGCAGYSPGDLGAGATESQIVDRMGPPTDRFVSPDGGSLLEYARGPFGKHTYRVELDATGRVKAVSQLLTEVNFEALPIGASSGEVRSRLGRPSETRVGWRGVGEVWSYRYEWFNVCRWFQVWLVDGRVREAAYATDPICDERRFFIGDD